MNGFDWMVPWCFDLESKEDELNRIQWLIHVWIAINWLSLSRNSVELSYSASLIRISAEISAIDFFGFDFLVSVVLSEGLYLLELFDQRLGGESIVSLMLIDSSV